jgi:hypothetical protein
VRPSSTLWQRGHHRLNEEFLGSHHKFSEHLPQRLDVATVINEPTVANSIANLNVPVVYDDSRTRRTPIFHHLRKSLTTARKNTRSNCCHPQTHCYGNGTISSGSTRSIQQSRRAAEISSSMLAVFTLTMLAVFKVI